MLSKAMEQTVEEVLDVLEARARELTELFWAKHWERRARGEQGYLGVRARRRQSSVSVEWYLRRYRGAEEQRQQWFEHLPRGQGFRYPAQAFRRCQPWERELALELEKDFGEIRRLSQVMAETMAVVRRCDQILEAAGVYRGQKPKSVAIRNWLDEELNRDGRGNP